MLPDNSIKYDNRFFVQHGVDNLTGFVEVALTNTMKDETVITKLQALDSKDAKVLSIEGINEQYQVIPRRSTYKFLISYQLNQDVNLVKDYGRIQFVWKANHSQVEGGILAYNVVFNLDKRPEDLVVERADSLILKKFEVAQVKLQLHNM